MAALPATSSAQVFVGIGVGIPPPAIPVYVQPPCPTPNFIWQPGYWAWGPGGYYWVPGTWVAPLGIGLLWTPGYWGWNSGAYYWHRGYWGPTVGFYGGINYGFGYFGTGFVGGSWHGSVFRYNTAVTRVNTTVIHNTYIDRSVVVKNYNRTSFNGGHGGINAYPSRDEIMSRKHGMAPTSGQMNHETISSQDRNKLSTVNQGHPHTAAVTHPYSAYNRPPNFTPVTSADRQKAQQHVAPQGQHNRPPR